MPPYHWPELTEEQHQVWRRIIRWSTLYGDNEKGFRICKYTPLFGEVSRDGIVARGKHMRIFVKRKMVEKITTDIPSVVYYRILPEDQWVTKI